MAYTLLSEINPTSKHWTVCARVSRLWEYRGNVDDAEIQHLDLVLVDEQGNAIYAEIPKEHVEAKRVLLQEEHIYTFRRFLVSPNKGKYRPVDSDYMIEIGYYTEIEELFDAAPTFPMYAYTLTPLENLDSYIGETRNFLDVIGVVKAVSNAASIQGSNQSSTTTKRLVVIKDAKDCETTVTLWGQRAKDFDGEYVYEKEQKNPVPALFVGILMKRYGQNEGLSGGSACRWYISPNIPEAAAITSSLQTTHGATSSAQKRLFDVAAASDQNLSTQTTNLTEEHASHDVTDDKPDPTAEKNITDQRI
uniref:Putative retrotransposon protein n=1 Tax=Phyllostachys edulis TaxID=38705 RepID=D3IVN9_PHYED|nr:putative retrotransposon protein [Phyllostachys edulis]